MNIKPYRFNLSLNHNHKNNSKPEHSTKTVRRKDKP
jgi:hypothetical protein